MYSISGHSANPLQTSYFMPSSPTSAPPNYYMQETKQSPPPLYANANVSMSTPNRYQRKTEESEPMSTSPINFQHGSRDYLPSFLTGESQQSSTISKGIPPATPERRRRISMSFASDPMTASPGKGLQQEKEEVVLGKQGPPTSGIGRVNENNSFCSLFPTSPVGDRRNLNISTGFVPSIVPTPKSAIRASFSGIGTKAATGSSSSWVTVFGFSSSSITDVIAHFSQFGTILEWKTNPGSNWIHLNYSNVVEARRALQKNGTVIAGTMMVGVRTCTEEMAREGLPPGASSFYQPSPLSKSITDNSVQKENVSPLQGNTTVDKNNPTPVQQSQQKSGMKSLGREATGLQLPQQRGGFMSWALDTIFGW